MAHDIDECFRRIETMAKVTLGHGPAHPEAPDESRRIVVESVLRRYAFLSRDSDYLYFLYAYFGAVSFHFRETDWLVTLPTLLDLQLEDPSIPEEPKFFMFAHANLYQSITSPLDNMSVGIYSFWNENNSKVPVKFTLRVNKVTLHNDLFAANGFADWLQRMISNRGAWSPP